MFYQSMRPLVVGAVIVLAATMGNAAAEDNPEILMQDADALFNQGKLRKALDQYVEAGNKSGGGPLLCEALNGVAAVHQADGDAADFRRAFVAARNCVFELPRRTASSGSGNLLSEGDFEEGLVPPWGSGHYERAQGKFKFGTWWNSNNARAFMKTDTALVHDGRRSLRITNYSPSTPHVFTTMSQRIEGLEPNTVYRVSLWAKADNLAPGAVFFTVDPAWTKRAFTLPRGSYDWKRFSAAVNIGNVDYIDFRILHTSTGTVWLDDISIVPEKTGPDAPGDPNTRLAAAQALYDAGRFSEALSRHQALHAELPDHRRVRLEALRYMGRSHMAMGDYEAARRDFEALAAENGHLADMELGDLFYRLGRYEDAADHFSEALESVKGDQGTMSLVLEKLSRVQLALGEPQAALDSQAKALRILRHIGDVHGQAKALRTLGSTHLDQGDLDQAMRDLEEARRLEARSHNPELKASILTLLAEVRLGQKEPDRAKALALDAADIAESMGNTPVQVGAHHMLGRAHRDLGANDRALEAFRRAVTLLEGIYASIGTATPEQRRDFLGQFRDLYDDYQSLLLEMHGAGTSGPDLSDEAFRAAERVRARQFSEMVAEARALQSLSTTVKDPEIARALEAERAACSQWAAAQPGSSFGATGATRESSLEARLVALERDCAAAARKVQRLYPRYADLKRPPNLDLAGAMRLLRPNEGMLVYAQARHRTGLWAITRSGARLTVLPLGRQRIRQSVLAFVGAIPAVLAGERGITLSEPAIRRAPSYDIPAARELYRTLVAPAEDLLKNKTLVYIVPDDVLYRLPFGALLSQPFEEGERGLADAPYWIREQVLATLPSASVLASLRGRRTAEPATRGDRKPLLAFANPVFTESVTRGNSSSDTARSLQARRERLHRLVSRGVVDTALPALPETADEARAAAEALRGGPDDIFLGEHATETRLKDMPLNVYERLLFATHGLMAGEFGPGMQPALALSFLDAHNDGLLEMSEILGLRLSAELVVLSACNTGRAAGENDQGAGFAGLTRSFMYAGARSLAVTLWSVESRATVALMDEFYRALADTGRAHSMALAKRRILERAARREISAAWSHPYFWAGFVIVGEGA